LVQNFSNRTAIELKMKVGETETNHAATADDDDGEEEEEEEEEFWPAAPLLTEHKIHTIRFGKSTENICNEVDDERGALVGGSQKSHVLRYKSMPSEALTPLDMTYGNSVGGEHCDDEFYDGTGNLMWMAAVCFGHLVAQNVEPLRTYLPTLHPQRQPDEPSTAQQHRVCELGCGTGGAGISLLLCSDSRAGDDDYNSDDGQDQEGTAQCVNGDNGADRCHVVFTDNDAESLELCRSNCKLNHLDPRDYSHELLWWGPQDQPAETEEITTRTETQTKSPQTLERHSFDTVLATDVVYDLKMIAPLMQTVDYLLKRPAYTNNSGESDINEKKTESNCKEKDRGQQEGGHLILSHVPRFCIPRTDDGDGDISIGSDEKDADENHDQQPKKVFLELERFIQSEASKVGLSLFEIVRPHAVLSEDRLDATGDECTNDSDDNDSMQQLTLEQMREAHAVLFIFRRV